MSNTRKITANKKNREENGIRALRDGSNPHSNADVFSRSYVDFIEIAQLSVTRIGGTIIEIVRRISNTFI